VPIYEVGNDGPLCYIAAGYCDGPTLAEWLKQHSSPLPWHEAAALVARVADATGHAHLRGIIHRDIKPANVLLAPAETGSTGVAPLLGQWVTPCLTDFGLARLIDDDASDRTRVGAMLGTPCYMAPEQADGRTEQIGPATDVYALGAVLYELLVGRAPFRGDNDLETLRLVSAGELVHPSALRPGVPRDLEAICLRCLDKSPSRRYACAAELAADLGRFLSGRATLARPLTRVATFARWCHRKPAAAALAATCIVAATVIAGGGWWYSARLSEALAVTQIAQRQTDGALRVSRQAVDKMYTEVAEKWLASDGALSDLQETFLSDALRFYEGFANEQSTNDDARMEAATACLRIGELRSQLLRRDEAEAALAKAVSLYDGLLEERSDDARVRHALARALKARAYNSVRRGRIEEASLALNRAVEILRQLVAESPANDDFRFDLADVGIFDHFATWGKYDEAVAFLVEARQHVERLIRTHPRRLAYTVRLVEIDWRQGDRVDWQAHDYRAAEAILRQAIALDDAWVRQEAEYPLFRWYLSFCTDSLGRVFWATGRLEEAEDAYRSAVEVRAEVARRFPHEMVKVHTELLAHRNLAALLKIRGKLAEAHAQWQEELVIAERIAHLASPNSSSFSTVHLLEAHRHLAKSALQLADENAAEEHALKTLEFCRLLWHHVNTGDSRWLPEGGAVVVGAYATAGNVLARHRRYEPLFEHLSELTAKPELEGARTAALRLVECLVRSITADEQLEPLRRTSFIESALATASDCLASCDAGEMSASDLNGVAWLLATTDVAALRDLQRALPFAEAAVRQQPNNRDYLNTLGAAYYYAGRWGGARTKLLQCLRLDAPNAYDLFFLAMTCWQLGEKAEARQWYDQGAAWIEREHQTDGEIIRFRGEAERLLGSVPTAVD
jgi:tetratricopeptide (TPR) repeat protein